MASGHQASSGGLSRPAYSPIDKALYSLALSWPGVGEMLFDLERAFAPAAPDGAREGRHVFVASLARAGTTTIMRALHGGGAFASLTYRDMPFVMAPNFWARLSRGGRRRIEKAERAHGDSIDVDLDSPEALEEPFWRVFCGRDYIGSDRLVPHAVANETITNYRAFVRHVLACYGAERYLAKNNNSILRLNALCAAFPAATIVAPFRAPLAQAQSLQRQHERFGEPDDRFVTRYMGWLAHHEFGADHRPFVFDTRRPAGDPATADYWLSAWISAYNYLLNTCHSETSQIVPISYEDFCAPDRTTWRALCARIGVSPYDIDAAARTVDAPPAVDPGLLQTADEIYARLRAVSRQRLNLDG